MKEVVLAGREDRCEWCGFSPIVDEPDQAPEDGPDGPDYGVYKRDGEVLCNDCAADHGWFG